MRREYVMIIANFVDVTPLLSSESGKMDSKPSTAGEFFRVKCHAKVNATW